MHVAFPPAQRRPAPTLLVSPRPPYLHVVRFLRPSKHIDECIYWIEDTPRKSSISTRCDPLTLATSSRSPGSVSLREVLWIIQAASSQDVDTFVAFVAE